MEGRFYARFLYKEGLDLEELRLLMRHEKIDTTKDYIPLLQEDAIDSLRKRKIEFFENGSRVNPDRSSRPGRAEGTMLQTPIITNWGVGNARFTA